MGSSKVNSPQAVKAQGCLSSSLRWWCTLPKPLPALLPWALLSFTRLKRHFLNSHCFRHIVVLGLDCHGCEERGRPAPHSGSICFRSWGAHPPLLDLYRCLCFATCFHNSRQQVGAGYSHFSGEEVEAMETAHNIAIQHQGHKQGLTAPRWGWCQPTVTVATASLGDALEQGIAEWGAEEH